MKIFSTQQIKAWDAYTIEQEPISSANLMERAADNCFNWLSDHYTTEPPFMVFCGVGNNGGDGLVIARQLHLHDCEVSIFYIGDYNRCTRDFSMNYDRLRDNEIEIAHIESHRDFPPIPPNCIVIDALLGTGVNKPLEGLLKELVEHINKSSATVIAIDMPTGMMADQSSAHCTRIIASHTLSFQCMKQAFFMPENSDSLGEVAILDISLHKGFYRSEPTTLESIDAEMIGHIIRPRPAHAHKGDFGHAALVAGSTGMMGAAVLAARACLRSGVGKLTCHVPLSGYEIVQISAPEAMTQISGPKDVIETLQLNNRYSAVGIGPGIGTAETHTRWMTGLFQSFKQPVVVDADALNLLAKNAALWELLPHRSILTPHVGEFERLFGPCKNDFERCDLALLKASMLHCYIVLKGHHTFIACPDGKGYFNTTGNAGMATGGSGDVLTGFITGLLAQGYSPKEAAIAGVYLHGLAGDFAAAVLSQPALTAGDLVNYLGAAFLKVLGR
jgi:ADP-dependent NAD(P)H-hydrate dehydratase / NAD(P)H-hydrate epimerase